MSNNYQRVSSIKKPTTASLMKNLSGQNTFRKSITSKWDKGIRYSDTGSSEEEMEEESDDE